MSLAALWGIIADFYYLLNVSPSTWSLTYMLAMSAVLYHRGLPGISSDMSLPLIVRFSKRTLFTVMLSPLFMPMQP